MATQSYGVAGRTVESKATHGKFRKAVATRKTSTCSGRVKELAENERDLAIVAFDLKSAKYSYKMLKRQLQKFVSAVGNLRDLD